VAEVKIEPDSDVIVARTQGREGWLREARHQLDEHRRLEAKPIVRSRAQRLLEAEGRMVQDLEVERAAGRRSPEARPAKPRRCQAPQRPSQRAQLRLSQMSLRNSLRARQHRDLAGPIRPLGKGATGPRPPSVAGRGPAVHVQVEYAREAEKEVMSSPPPER
jgi:hypothetical protein